MQLLDEIDAQLSEVAQKLADPETADQPFDDEASFEVLRKILFGEYRDQISYVQSDLDRVRRLLDQIEQQINDNDALARTISPIIASAITTSIRDSREQMVEALYPIIGQMVVRAVSEAMRDLARRIDHQMRSTLNVQTVSRRLQARLLGVPQGEMALRHSLPYHVQEVFLIHRESGLLLNHISRDSASSADSDLISGMLTAIRDFAADAFGQGKQEQLSAIQYGDKVISIEVAQHAYIAIVIEGIEPQGIRAEMRARVIDIEHEYAPILRQYDGDATPFSAASPILATLLQAAEAVAPNTTDSPSPIPTQSSPVDGLPLIAPEEKSLSRPALSPDLAFMITVIVLAVFLLGLLFWQLQS